MPDLSLRPSLGESSDDPAACPARTLLGWPPGLGEGEPQDDPVRLHAVRVMGPPQVGWGLS